MGGENTVGRKDISVNPGSIPQTTHDFPPPKPGMTPKCRARVSPEHHPQIKEYETFSEVQDIAQKARPQARRKPRFGP